MLTSFRKVDFLVRLVLFYVICKCIVFYTFTCYSFALCSFIFCFKSGTLCYYVFIIDMPLNRTMCFASCSFLIHTEEWIVLTAFVIPEIYNIELFKARTNKHFLNTYHSSRSDRRFTIKEYWPNICILLINKKQYTHFPYTHFFLAANYLIDILRII